MLKWLIFSLVFGTSAMADKSDRCKVKSVSAMSNEGYYRINFSACDKLSEPPVIDLLRSSGSNWDATVNDVFRAVDYQTLVNLLIAGMANNLSVTVTYSESHNRNLLTGVVLEARPRKSAE